MNDGPATYSVMTLSICGVALPALPGPTSYVGFQLPAYTAWDLFSDTTAIQNFASVLLMSNVKPGSDPTRTGIELPAALQRSRCEDFNWSTAHIQQDAASIQTAARSDGLAHPWPTQQQVAEYLNSSYLCARAGFYSGIHFRNEPVYLPDTEQHALVSYAGNFSAFVDHQGQVEGHMDFSAEPGTEQYDLAAIPFSGAVAIEPGGIGRVNYTAPADAQLPYLRVRMSLYPHGASGEWQAGDGATSGSTESMEEYDVPRLGLESYPWEYYPKYRFLAKNLSYTPFGESASRGFVLIMDVGYDNEVSGGLLPWPPEPRKHPSGALVGSITPLDWRGRMTDNIIEVKWNEAKDGTPTTSEAIILTLDLSTMSLTGGFPSKHGEPFTVFTHEQPLRGCRL